MKLNPLLALSVLCLCAVSITAAAARCPDAKRGHELFDAMTCSMCHVNGDNVLEPKKPLRGPWFRQHFPTDASIADVIRRGVPGTSMDSFRKDRLSDEQLADIIAYIRSLPQPDAPKAPAHCPAAAHASGQKTQQDSSGNRSGSSKGKSSSGGSVKKSGLPHSLESIFVASNR